MRDSREPGSALSPKLGLPARQTRNGETIVSTK
jgi:hypothetical protein